MNNVKLTGILKLSLDVGALATVRSLRSKLPSEASPLAENDLHVTLANQNAIRPFKTFIAGMALPEGPQVDLDDVVYRVVRPDKVSWIALVKNQNDMQDYVDEINDTLQRRFGTGIDEDRVFHVSLANLTGNPYSSVGDVSWNDIEGPDETND